MIIPPLFDGLPVRSFFTGRSLRCDLPAVAAEGRVEASRIYMPIQKHTDMIVFADYDTLPEIADAVITGRAGLLIGVRAADCVPLLLYDPVRRVAGAVHAGWRGTAAGIVRKTVLAMLERFHSSPADILLAVGPSIKGCCYEVGDEVADAVLSAAGEGDYITRKGAKYYLDLPLANRRQALSAGLSDEHIWIAGDCTHCLPEKYFSYRFEPGTTGRQGGFIGIV